MSFQLNLIPYKNCDWSFLERASNELQEHRRSHPLYWRFIMGTNVELNLIWDHTCDFKIKLACSFLHPFRNTHLGTKVAKFTTQWFFFCLTTTCNSIYYFKEALKSDWLVFVLVFLSHWLGKKYDLEQK